MSDSSSGQTLVMSSFGANSLKENNKATFWKKSAKTLPGSIKPVYGAQHPPRQEKPSSEHGTPKRELRGKQRDSFQDFQDNTEDAWDDGDDDLITMANSQTVSKQDIDSLALQVINNHSLQTRMAANGSNSGLPDVPPSPTHFSAQNTPTHSGSGMAGPGVGVRMNHWHHQRLGGRGGQLMVAGKEESKTEKFKMLIAAQNLDLEELRKHSWSGIPMQYRPTTWKILSGYLPASIDRRELTLERKRKEYYNFIEQYFDTRHQDLHQDTFRQIHIDIPRMNPLMPLFQEEVVQEIFERILFIWAIRHPASGYVQGINDLVTPFFVVFLSEYVQELENPKQLLQLPQETLRMVEADCFWCFSKLLDGIQDNYTFAQPGIQVKVNHLKELISRIDGTLHKHLERHHIEYLQFSFRWMNNLLMREMPLRCTIRLWDTYLSEPEGFASFHLYVCAAFLSRFSEDLRRERDFQGLMLMLQNLPTNQWSNEEINLLLAEAYKLKFMFADAPKHLAKK